MQGCIVPKVFQRPAHHYVMVKNQFRFFSEGDPVGVVRFYRFLIMVLDVDQGKKYDRQGALHRVAVHFAKGCDLLDVDIFQSRQIV